jgi:hypothetical protein
LSKKLSEDPFLTYTHFFSWNLPGPNKSSSNKSLAAEGLALIRQTVHPECLLGFSGTYSRAGGLFLLSALKQKRTLTPFNLRAVFGRPKSMNLRESCPCDRFQSDCFSAALPKALFRIFQFGLDIKRVRLSEAIRSRNSPERKRIFIVLGLTGRRPQRDSNLDSR